MLCDGKFDVVFGEICNDLNLVLLFLDFVVEVVKWYVWYGVVLVNYFVVVMEKFVQLCFDVVFGVYDLLKCGKNQMELVGSVDFLLFGIEVNRKFFELIIDYVFQQSFILCCYWVDELFDVMILGLY